MAKGFFHNRILTLWTTVLLVGAFSAVLFPFSGVDLWYRWMFMLAYPFTFFAVYGLHKVYRNILSNQSHVKLSTLFFSSKKWLP